MQLTHEHEELKRNLKRFIEDEINPHVDDWEAAEMFPAHEVFGKLGELGYLGLTKPEVYGGSGLDYSYSVIMAEALGHISCGALPMAIGVQTDMATPALARFGSQALCEEFLTPAIRGKAVACIGVSEPHAGSDVSAIKTTARKDGDDYIINGGKMWITNGSKAQVAIIWAKTGESQEDSSIRGFVVDTSLPGFHAKDQHGKLSLRASHTSELVLTDVHVPADALLPESKGLKSPLMCLTQARYGISWGVLGAAMACFEEAVSYAKTRVMFDKPIGGFQIQQVRLADMLTELTKAQLVSLHLGRLKDAGNFTPTQVSLAKRNNVSIATDIAREARRLLGGNGILAEYGAMRHMANLESVYTYEGTHDVHSLILGQAITGLNAFK
jgi:glutaryl-CoA dehydrogenase